MGVVKGRSHSSHSIQPMHLLFVLYQSDQPFLRYVQVFNLEKTYLKFQRKFGKNIPLKSYQVISMTRSI